MSENTEYIKGFADGKRMYANTCINIVKLYNTLGLQRSECKCGRTIWWCVTKNGKRMPITDEAISHFADCPNSKTFRKSTQDEPDQQKMF